MEQLEGGSFSSYRLKGNQKRGKGWKVTRDAGVGGGERKEGAVAESDGLNDTCALGRGWSRTELDHDD